MTTTKRLEKTITYSHDLDYYLLDSKEFEEGMKYLHTEKQIAEQRLKELGAEDNIQIYFDLELENFWGEPDLEFAFRCSGTRMETDEEMHKRKQKNAKAAATRALQKLQKEEQEKKLLAKLKAKYEEE